MAQYDINGNSLGEDRGAVMSRLNELAGSSDETDVKLGIGDTNFEARPSRLLKSFEVAAKIAFNGAIVTINTDPIAVQMAEKMKA